MLPQMLKGLAPAQANTGNNANVYNYAYIAPLIWIINQLSLKYFEHFLLKYIFVSDPLYIVECAK